MAEIVSRVNVVTLAVKTQIARACCFVINRAACVSFPLTATLTGSVVRAESVSMDNVPENAHKLRAMLENSVTQ